MNMPTATFEIDIVERINQLEREVSGQGAKLDAIKDSISRLASNVDRPTNWIGVGSLIVAGFALSMSFMSLVTSGVEEQVDRLEQHITVSTPIIYEHASDLEHIIDQIKEHKKDIKSLMYGQGRLDAYLEYKGKDK
jgi:archaellum component FlaC